LPNIHHQHSTSPLAAADVVVLFMEYGNHEEVLLSDMLPYPAQHQQQQRHPRGPTGFIPTTPGLPPAFPQS
jgi:hypothetical protein